MVAYAWQRDSHNLTVDKHFESIWFQAFFLLNGQMWLMVKLPAELEINFNGQRLWQNDNASTGNNFLIVIIACGTEVAYTKLVCFVPFPLFSQTSNNTMQYNTIFYSRDKKLKLQNISRKEISW